MEIVAIEDRLFDILRSSWSSYVFVFCLKIFILADAYIERYKINKNKFVDDDDGGGYVLFVYVV